LKRLGDPFLVRLDSFSLQFWFSFACHFFCLLYVLGTDYTLHCAIVKHCEFVTCQINEVVQLGGT
jgi:hypothetical protein